MKRPTAKGCARWALYGLAALAALVVITRLSEDPAERAARDKQEAIARDSIRAESDARREAQRIADAAQDSARTANLIARSTQIADVLRETGLVAREDLAAREFWVHARVWRAIDAQAKESATILLGERSDIYWAIRDGSRGDSRRATIYDAQTGRELARNGITGFRVQ